MKLRIPTLAAAMLASHSSPAATYNWTGTTSGAWNASIPANWNATSPTFDNTADLLFGKNVPIATYNTWLGTPASGSTITVRSLSFENFSTALNVGLNNNSTTARVLAFSAASGNASVTMSANVTGAVTLGTTAPNNNGSITLASNLAVTNNSAALLTIGRPINESLVGASLSKSGTGPLVLSAANTFTGSVTVNAGTLDLRNTSALGTKTGTSTTVAAGASLILGATGLNFRGEQVTVAGTGVGGLGVIQNTSGAQLQSAFDKVILSGDATLSSVSRFDIRDATSTGQLALDLAGFTFTKIGAQVLYFDGCTISAGKFDVQQGELGFQNGVLLGVGNPDDTMTIRNGGALRVWRSVSGFPACTLERKIVIEDGGAIRWNGNNTTDEVDQSIAAPITLSGTVTVQQDTAVGSIFELAGVVSGTGGITRTGTGILRMSAANTYTGPTDLQDGITQLRGSIPGTLTIGALATLEGTGSVGGPVTVTGKLHLNGASGAVTALAGGSINPAGVATVGSLQAAALSLDTSNLVMDTTAPANTDAIVIAANGAFTAAGITPVEVITQGGWQVADYPIIRYSGTTTAPAADPNSYLALQTSLGHAAGNFVDTGSAVVLRITSAPSNTWSGATDANWDTTTPNWRLAGNLYINGDAVVFDETATGNFAVNLDATVSPASVTFTNTGNSYSLASALGGGGIAGLGTSLTKNGTGLVTIATTNSFAGGSTINNGTLAVLSSATNEIPSLGSGPLVINAPGVFRVGLNGTVANNISGNGAVLKSHPSGTTVTTFSGNNSYTGTTTVAEGTLVIGSPTALGGITGATYVEVDAQLYFGTPLANGSTVAEPITLQGGADVVLPGFYVGNTKTGIIQSGLVSIENDAVMSFDGGTSLDCAAGVNYSGVGSGATLTIQGSGLPSISGALTLGTGSLVQAGPGTLTLANGGNSYVNTTVTSGTLALTGNGTLGSGTNTVASGAFLTLSGTLNNPFAKTLTGDGILLKTGAGNAELAAINGLTGGTQLDAGLLLIGSDGLLGSGVLYVNGGALAAKDATPRTVSNPVRLGANPAFGDLAGVFNAPVTYTGNIDFGATTRQVRAYTDTTWATGSNAGGMIRKLGTATLTLRGVHDWSAGATHEIYQGTVVIDGATVTNKDAVRVMAVDPAATARFSLINGGSFTIQLGTANLRLGYTGGDATSTNIVDVGGTLTLPAGNTGGKVQMGTASAATTLNLNAGGNLLTAAIQDNNAASNNVVNCNGGKLTVILDSTNTSATGFMQGLDAVRILDGGLTLDTNGNNALVNQALQPGGANVGGLTKQGLGTLSLGGANAYGGATVVEAGTLAVVAPGTTGTGTTTVQTGATVTGTGTVNAAATIQGTVSPGASVGALSIGGQLTLAAGSAVKWEVSNWNALLPAVDYDTMAAGSLDLTATAANPVTIQVNELALANFAEANRSFTLVTTSGGIINFAANKFVVDAAAFTFGKGTWSVNVSGDNKRLLLEYQAAAANDYGAWADGYSLVGLDREPGADPDKDGMTNQQEYAFGLNPTSGASVTPVKVPVNKATGKFSYTRRDPALTKLSYGIEKSTTLATGGWMSDATATQNVISTVDNIQTVEVTLSGTPPLADTKLFVRVVAQ